jgi:hypothetical protein
MFPRNFDTYLQVHAASLRIRPTMTAHENIFILPTRQSTHLRDELMIRTRTGRAMAQAVPITVAA